MDPNLPEDLQAGPAALPDAVNPADRPQLLRPDLPIRQSQQQQQPPEAADLEARFNVASIGGGNYFPSLGYPSTSSSSSSHQQHQQQQQHHANVSNYYPPTTPRQDHRSAGSSNYVHHHHPPTPSGSTSASIYNPKYSHIKFKVVTRAAGSEGTESRKQYLYNSEKHPNFLLEHLTYLRKRKELCDVVLIVGSKRLFAHRVVLASSSAYFHSMFTSDLIEKRKSEIPIHDVDEGAMELLIDFCYQSKIYIDENNVQTLLPAACLLQVTEIQDVCCEFLKQEIDASNCLGIRSFADTHACQDLLEYAEKYTQDYFLEVIEHEEFLLLPVNQLIDIISSDELNVTVEEQVYQAVMKWIRYQLSERTVHLSHVLLHIRLSQLTAKFLVGTVSTDILIKNDQMCRDLVDEAKNYLLLPQERPHMVGPRFRPRKPVRRGEVLFAAGGECPQKDSFKDDSLKALVWVSVIILAFFVYRHNLLGALLEPLWNCLIYWIDLARDPFCFLKSLFLGLFFFVLLVIAFIQMLMTIGFIFLIRCASRYREQAQAQ